MNNKTDQNPKLPPGDKDAKTPTPPEAGGSSGNTATASEPNVQFVGRREELNKATGKLETVPAFASRRISDGETIINLPPDAEQKAGFYSQHAARLLALFPGDYKKPVEKGEQQ